TVSAVWGVSHLIEVLKVIEGDVVELTIPDNMKSVKVSGVGDEHLLYFAMVINNPKYTSAS
ncbi:MAG: hypothetical protein WC375_08530, partial [Methanomassiliicoccales archaeon]